jgi:ribosomal protein S18 acetylase RimI-like enzyme
MINKKKQITQEIEMVKEYTPDALHDILMLENKCFPKEWQYVDVADYYKNILKNKHNINIFLKEKNQVIGYVLGVPHNVIYDELKRFDPFLQKKNNYYYIETIQVLPKSQGRGGANKLIIKLCEEANKRGIKDFSIHARMSNKFNDKLKKIFKGRIIDSRKIDKWKFGGNEPYEYMEWKYSNNESNQQKQ